MVEHAAGLQLLLAAALLSLVRVVSDEHLDLIDAGLYKLRHIKAESRIASSVASDPAPVPVYCASLIYRAEVQYEAPACGQVRNLCFSSVPERLARHERAADPRAPCLGRKGDQYLAVRDTAGGIHRLVCRADPVIPPAVQADPVRAPKLGPRILRKRNSIGAIDRLLAPDGAQFMNFALLFPAKLQGCDRVFQSHILSSLSYVRGI